MPKTEAGFTQEVPPDREKIECPVCSSESFIQVFEKNNEPFVRCESCSLLLINPRPVYNKVLDTYSRNYSEKYSGKHDKKLKRCRRWVARTKSFYGGTGRWLDVGCSVGFVVKAAAETGFDAYGVDVEKWGIEYGRRELGLNNLHAGPLEEQNFPDGFFSCISLYDVIEHVPDLNSHVAELKRIL